MAFSKADGVMISLGKMFFSTRFRMAAPTLLHSSIFSGDSAGNDDEPGSVIPRASIALAIVFAVYIYASVNVETHNPSMNTYTTACARSGACMSNRGVTELFCFKSLTVLDEFPVRLEGRNDVQLWLSFAGSWAYSTAVNHQAWSIQASDCQVP